ncbi:MAG TPA: hypothetical protein VJ824_15765 [Bacillota bacterium]|nr:hypothetical protein [Bacillota bacterium]
MSYHKEQLTLFWEEHLRKLNPQRYYVELSQKVWNEKMQLIRQNKYVLIIWLYYHNVHS